jgi:hypothetical protein
MQKILIGLGIVSILASIVGGGVKVGPIEFPKLESKLVRGLLAIFGIGLLAAAVVLHPK